MTERVSEHRRCVDDRSLESVPTAGVVPCSENKPQCTCNSSEDTTQAFCTHATELVVSPVAFKSHYIIMSGPKVDTTT